MNSFQSIQNAVLSKWKSLFTMPNAKCHWLGITDSQSEGTWRYDSDNNNIFFSSWQRWFSVTRFDYNGA